MNYLFLKFLDPYVKSLFSRQDLINQPDAILSKRCGLCASSRGTLAFLLGLVIGYPPTHDSTCSVPSALFRNLAGFPIATT